jgi:hypothetical protein
MRTARSLRPLAASFGRVVAQGNTGPRGRKSRLHLEELEQRQVPTTL